MDTTAIRNEWLPQPGSRLDRLIADVDAAQARQQAGHARQEELRRRFNELAHPGDAPLAQRALERAEREEAAEQLLVVRAEIGEARIALNRAQYELQRALGHLAVPAEILKAHPLNVKRARGRLAACHQKIEATEAHRQALAGRGVVLAVADPSPEVIEKQIADLHERRNQAEKELERRRAFWCGAGQPRPEMAGNGGKWPETARA